MLSKVFVATWVYISVVLVEPCPRSTCIYLKSVPDSNKCVAKLCRNTWGVTVVRILAFSAEVLTIFKTLAPLYLVPFLPSNKYVRGSYLVQ